MAPKNTRKPAPKQAQRAPAPKAQPKRHREREEPAPGSVFMRLALLLCTGLVVVGLLFSSVVGGSEYVGLPEEDTTKATPTPPMETIDPNLNVQGSDMTPIPPSATPEAGATTEDSTTTEQPTP
ncbi:MAG: hypothetical protein IIV43_05725 [Oscillospiraceae bacterium]|nr:hypothetical protein [Oscillospiraceae bacterium]